MRRPGTEDPHRFQRKFNGIFKKRRNGYKPNLLLFLGVRGRSNSFRTFTLDQTRESMQNICKYTSENLYTQNIVCFLKDQISNFFIFFRQIEPNALL
jgi:hypothetical protein